MPSAIWKVMQPPSAQRSPENSRFGRFDSYPHSKLDAELLLGAAIDLGIEPLPNLHGIFPAILGK